MNNGTPPVRATAPTDSQLGADVSRSSLEQSVPHPGDRTAAHAPHRVTDMGDLDPDTLATLEDDCGEELPYFIQRFLSETHGRMLRIERGMALGNAAAVSREAHTMKGGALTFGCRLLAERAGRVEAVAKKGTEHLEPLVGGLAEVLDAVTVALEQRYPGVATKVQQPV